MAADNGESAETTILLTFIPLRDSERFRGGRAEGEVDGGAEGGVDGVLSILKNDSDFQLCGF